MLAYLPHHDEPIPVCPICRSECDEAYYDKNGKIVGCDVCITRKSWEDAPELLNTEQTDLDWFE